MDSAILLRRLESDLPRYRFSFVDEKQLHDGLATVLTEIGIPFEREHVASENDRLDFFLYGSVAIEVKTNGSLSDALHQIDRYCGLDAVQAVIVAHTKAWHSAAVHRMTIREKPVLFVKLKRKIF